MRTNFLALVVVAFCVATSAFGSEDEGHVVALTGDTFEKFVAENDVALVEFYAPWCGHCKKLEPEYEAAAKQLKESGSKVRLGKVDSTQEEELARKFDVMGYPTLKLFRNGKAEEYKGGRTASTIVQWIESMTGPSVEIVDNKAAAETIASKASIAYIGAFSEKDNAAFKTFQSVADENRLFGRYIAYVDSGEKNTVTVQREDEGVVATQAIDKKEDLEKLLKEERFPYFGPINGDNYADYFGSGRELVWFASEEDAFKSNAATIRAVAKEFRSQYCFVWLDTEKFKDHAQSSLGVKEFPSLVVQTKEGRFVYPENKFESPAAVSTFLKDAVSGKIEKFLMSEPIPETNDEPVKVVVGKNFKEMVLQADKDVMLEVYAPWCGHCKKFEPIYVEFAEKMARNKNLVIAKMDGTANESPVADFEWRGFPTIWFVKAGSDKPLSFNNDRTLEGLTDYVKEHSSTPLETEEAVKEEL